MKDATGKKNKENISYRTRYRIYLIELPSFMEYNLMFINSLDMIALRFLSDIY